MNNALNAKLSKLIYALASDDPNYLAKAGVFDRLSASFIRCWTRARG